MRTCLSVKESGDKWQVYGCLDADGKLRMLRQFDSEEVARAWMQQQCQIDPDRFYVESDDDE